MEELFTIRFTVGGGVLPYSALIIDGNTNYSDTITINTDGTYEFINVPRGSYSFVVEDDNVGVFTQTINV